MENERREGRMEEFAESFEAWAEACVRIAHKDTCETVPFVLNGGQRKVLAMWEAQRRAGRPIRSIVLKSRQWGCSTLTTHYMAWLQLFHGEQRHSVICAHTKETAIGLQQMYKSLEGTYPQEYEPESGAVRVRSMRGMQSVLELQPAGCMVKAATAGRPDSVRGMAYSMAHLSEVAYWPDTAGASPQKTVRAICSAVPRVKGTMVVMESTANGTGGYFYDEWMRAIDGKSDKEAVFVSWSEIEYFREELDCSEEEFLASLDEYERMLWCRGLTLEQIRWYRSRLMEAGYNRRMVMSEYPLTPEEAFSNALPPVFDLAQLEKQREQTCEPSLTGDVSLPSGEIVATERGPLQVWQDPCKKSEVGCTNAYIVSVDVGGNYDEGDWSVIAVFDCRRQGRMELVAQWRGHTDADHLVKIADRLGRRYHKALLVVESNSLEARGLDVLERLSAGGYPNIFRRKNLDEATGEVSWRFGFHTNAQTKTAAITDLTAALRDGVLVERSALAVSEMATFVRTKGGKMEATRGCHDDLVMTRAIAAYALRQCPPRVRKPIF